MKGKVYEVIKYLTPIQCTAETVFNTSLVWEPVLISDEVLSVIYTLTFPHTKEAYDQALEKKAAFFDELKAQGYTALKIRAPKSNGIAFKIYGTKTKILTEAK